MRIKYEDKTLKAHYVHSCSCRENPKNLIRKTEFSTMGATTRNVYLVKFKNRVMSRM